MQPTHEHQELSVIFTQINEQHFDGFLDAPVLRWNQRLRSSAGRFIPGSRKWLREIPPVIEIATYLLEEATAEELVRDTMAHEMIHYWLWVRRKPYGHTPEFLEKMGEMGCSRYNPVPRTRPYKYIYRCAACSTEFPARKKLGILACARCCEKHSGGRYDARFRLLFDREVTVVQLSNAASEVVNPETPPADMSEAQKKVFSINA